MSWVQPHGRMSAPRALAALAALSFGALAGSHAQAGNLGRELAQSERPPSSSAPGAAPSASRLVGTWTVTEFKGGPSDGRSDRSETTTYRFEDSGNVTVAGSKQCTYALEGSELKVDCSGQVTAGTIEFRGDTTMVWTIGENQSLTLTKR